MPILVITETNDTYASLLCLKLGAHLDVVCATSESYRETLAQRDFSVIVVDAHTSGSHILDLCRNIQTLSEQPLLLLTYDFDEPYAVRAYDAGVSECVRRPVDTQLLAAKIAAWSRWSVVSKPIATPHSKQTVPASLFVSSRS